MVHEILICWLHILFREQIIFNILTVSTNALNSEASFLSIIQLYKKKSVVSPEGSSCWGWNM